MGRELWWVVFELRLLSKLLDSNLNVTLLKIFLGQGEEKL